MDRWYYCRSPSWVLSHYYEAYVNKIIYYTGPFVQCFIHLYIWNFLHIYRVQSYIKKFTGWEMIQSFLVGVLIRPHG